MLLIFNLNLFIIILHFAGIPNTATLLTFNNKKERELETLYWNLFEIIVSQTNKTSWSDSHDDNVNVYRTSIPATTRLKLELIPLKLVL